MRKLTNEQFTSRSKEIHGETYDYSKVQYVNAKTKVLIKCRDHGYFYQFPGSHINGSGCRLCGFKLISNSKKMSQFDFLDRAVSVHGNKYNLSESIYLGSDKPISVACIKHGVFYINPLSFLGGSGCQKCSYENISIRKTSSKEQFVKKAIKKWKGYYSYNKVKYKNSRTKVLITCPIHGDFLQRPADHMSGYGCVECGKESNRQFNLMSRDEYIEKAIKAHGKVFDYSLLEYNGIFDSVKIICPKHGLFEQRASDHLSGNGGCKKCKETKGEKRIRKYLESKGLMFDQEYSVNILGRYYRFDFIIHLLNIVIEYNGEQHYSPVAFFGGEKSYKNRLRSDKIKKQWAIDNGYNYIEIPYTDFDRIEDILKDNGII